CDRGHPAGGGARPCGAQPSRRAGLPPFAQDGTERRIVRPQAPGAQQESYSGKKKEVVSLDSVDEICTTCVLAVHSRGTGHDPPQECAIECAICPSRQAMAACGPCGSKRRNSLTRCAPWP